MTDCSFFPIITRIILFVRIPERYVIELKLRAVLFERRLSLFALFDQRFIAPSWEGEEQNGGSFLFRGACADCLDNIEVQMSTPTCDAIYICPGDPYRAPRGGQTAFAIQALNALGSRFALVSPDESGTKPIGVWFQDEWKGEPIWRFNIGSYAPKNKSRRPLIPRRIVFRRLIKKYLPDIRQISSRALFCDSPELLGVLRRYEWTSFCYRFAGLNNPVGVSRYGFLRFLAGWFHQRMLKNLALMRPDALLASADMETIRLFEEENRELLSGFPLRFFPTRFDKNVFHPGSAEECRRILALEDSAPILATVGRLCWVKGWELALDSLKLLCEKYPRIKLVFIGDGEDRAELEAYAKRLGVWEHVRVEGFQPPEEVRMRLTAADLYLCTSHREGWSVAMTEALGCGKVCVSTNVSGASDMIEDGANGRVVTTRESAVFADAVADALELSARSESASLKSLDLAARFSTATLAEDWGRLWEPLSGKKTTLTGVK